MPEESYARAAAPGVTSRSRATASTTSEGVDHWVGDLATSELVLGLVALVALVWQTGNGSGTRVAAEPEIRPTPTIGDPVFSFIRVRVSFTPLSAFEPVPPTLPRSARRACCSQSCSGAMVLREPVGASERVAGTVFVVVESRSSHWADAGGAVLFLPTPHFTGFTKWARGAHFC